MEVSTKHVFPVHSGPHVLRADLRREVWACSAGASPRAARLSVGHLGADRADAVASRRPDGQLCIDISVVVLEHSSLDSTAVSPGPGVSECHDLFDKPWLAGTRISAWILARYFFLFFVITRSGWLDPVTGDSRTWRRSSSGPPGAAETPGPSFRLPGRLPAPHRTRQLPRGTLDPPPASPTRRPGEDRAR